MNPETICLFGSKYRGQPWSAVPDSYLQWMVETCDSQRWRYAAQQMLDARMKATFNFDGFNDDQRPVGELIKSGVNVLIMGPAGAGKSFIINQISNKLILCPTGISALNANGQTFHSYFKINPSDPLVKAGNSVPIKKNLIVFDEVFYTSPVLLDAVLSQHPEIKDKQLIFTGDPYQLAPVKFKGNEDNSDSDEYTEDELELIEYHREISDGDFFDVLNNHGITFEVAELQSSVRHQDDPIYKEVLDKVRVGDATREDLAVINERVSDPDDAATILTFRKKVVRDYNDEYLKSFDDVVEFEAVFFDKYNDKVKEQDWYLAAKKKLKKAPHPFRVAVGANVVIVQNGDGYVNGDMGVVAMINQDDPEEPVITVKLNRNGAVIEFKQTRVVKGKEAMGWVNFPVLVAKAITIHKSQGCTLYGPVHLHIDPFLAGTWRGAVYTAISRARKLSQLTISQRLIPKFVQPPQVNLPTDEND